MEFRLKLDRSHSNWRRPIGAKAGFPQVLGETEFVPSSRNGIMIVKSPDSCLRLPPDSVAGDGSRLDQR
jgi:hypothetical protein